MIDDDIFKLIQKTYQNFFQKYKLIKCTKLLTDIEDIDEQTKIIQDYHDLRIHRGIDETLNHLKRT